jgi:hypothetical protein
MINLSFTPVIEMDFVLVSGGPYPVATYALLYLWAIEMSLIDKVSFLHDLVLFTVSHPL